ncbi:MAG: hypothetical protein WBW49_16680, partial [Candidatus Acidiferrum sp.]
MATKPIALARPRLWCRDVPVLAWGIGEWLTTGSYDPERTYFSMTPQAMRAPEFPDGSVLYSPLLLHSY